MPQSKSKGLLAIWFLLMAVTIVMLLWVIPNGSDKIAASAENPRCPKLLDLKVMGFDSSEAFLLLDCLGVEGRDNYASFAKTEDFFFPLSYGFFLALTIYMLAGFRLRRNVFVLALSALPLFAMLADLAENHHVVMLIQQFPHLQENTVGLASLSNILKWCFVFISVVFVAGLGLSALILKMRNIRIAAKRKLR